MKAWRMLVVAAVVFLTVVLSWRVHVRADGWMPVPWIDESTFAWPAIAFAETGSLVAPQANPDRAPFWMPPGYYLISGSIYRIVGYSPDVMRNTAWCFCLLFFLILTHWLYHEKWPLACIAIAACFMLNGFFVVMGNIGRMEPIVLSACLGAYWIIHKGRPWLGFSLIAAMGLVHPYSAMFCVFALLVTLTVNWRCLKRFTRWDGLAVAAAVVLWGMYVAYIGCHWQSFVSDMADQAAGHHEMLALDCGGDKESPGWLLSIKALLTGKYTPILIGGALLGIALWRFDPAALPLLAFGLACLVIRVLGAEQWYVVLAVNGILLILLVLFRLAVNLILPRLPAISRIPLQVAVLAVIAVVLSRVGLVPRPADYPGNLRWWMCSMQPKGDPYITADDKALILASLAKEEGISSGTRVEVLPRGEGLWFYPESKDQFLIHAPLFTKIQAEWQLIHRHPALLPIFPELDLGPDEAARIHTRGAHEWYLRRIPTETAK